MSWVSEALTWGLETTVLELHLQPVISLASETVFGAESFIRWRDPEGGLVPAWEWMPLAESTGVMVDCALKVLPLWAASSGHGSGPVVSFNLSGRQLLDPGFMAAMLEIPAVVAAGLAVEVPHLQFFVEQANASAPQWSWVEIPDLDERLAQLRSHGFSVWLDDYGDTLLDESSLAHPDVDVIKLDRTLLDHDRPSLSELCGRIHGHGKRTLIEGVETVAQREHARAAGVELAQGFLYAPPLTANAFAAFDRPRS